MNAFRNRVKPEKFSQARQLRSHPTSSEAFLWEHLREKQLGGLRFRRQSVILGWIADFYCPLYRLVVEVDGGYHSKPGQKLKDLHRDCAMSRAGFTVLRFPVGRVFNDLKAVKGEILAAVMTLPEYRNAGESGACGRRAGTRKDLPATEATKSRAS